MINDLEGKINLTKDQVNRICSRRTGVGADGLILLRSSQREDFKMTYLNSDGGEVEMCGNGTRALTYFYKEVVGDRKSEFSFETLNGVYKSQIKDNFVKVQMTELYEEGKIDVSDLASGSFSYYLNTGVPHCVFQVENLENYPLLEEGKRNRFEKRFKNGVNSNFFQEKDGIIHIRTYERGVENETLACGTGVTAVALALFLSGDKREVYNCLCQGGAIDIEIKSKEEIYLCGKVQKIYEGQVDSKFLI